MKLDELLRHHENTLMRIKTRLYVLLEIEKQFDSITQKKKFKIKNDIVYRMMMDTWDMLVIDLASLSKGMVGDGGLFNQIKANLNQVKPLNRKAIEVPKGRITFVGPHTDEDIERVQLELDEHFVEQIVQSNREALTRLFPASKGRVPLKIKSEDIDELKTKFDSINQVVHDDRNKHRAHKFEKDQGRAQTERLDFNKLKAKFEEVEQLMNDLRLVVTNSSLSYNDMNLANKTQVAKDLVTMVLWGSSINIDESSGINAKMNVGISSPFDRQYGYQLREKMIQDAHSFHTRIISGDIRPVGVTEESGKDFCFNDVSIPRAQRKSNDVLE